MSVSLNLYLIIAEKLLSLCALDSHSIKKAWKQVNLWLIQRTHAWFDSAQNLNLNPYWCCQAFFCPIFKKLSTVVEFERQSYKTIRGFLLNRWIKKSHSQPAPHNSTQFKHVNCCIWELVDFLPVFFFLMNYASLWVCKAWYKSGSLTKTESHEIFRPLGLDQAEICWHSQLLLQPSHGCAEGPEVWNAKQL